MENPWGAISGGSPEVHTRGELRPDLDPLPLPYDQVYFERPNPLRILSVDPSERE